MLVEMPMSTAGVDRNMIITEERNIHSLESRCCDMS